MEMNWEQFLLEVVKISLPALVVAGTVAIMLKRYFENEARKRAFELKSSNIGTTLPLRLHAYERLSLLLERISVNNLLARVMHPGMNAPELQVILLNDLRSEFDHNLAQQIYVSHDLWNMVSGAREDVAKQINMAAEGLDKDAPALDLAKKLVEIAMREEFPAPYRALLFLKREAADLL